MRARLWRVLGVAATATAALAVAVLLVLRKVIPRRLVDAPQPSVWPALDPTAPAAAWVEPVAGRCPEGYPVKAKLSSGIFHLPGMLNYERCRPDRCYRSADAALADGLRAAKR